MSVLINNNGSLVRQDAAAIAQLAAVDTEGILGGTPGATTNGQTLVDQLAADDVQAQTDIGQIRTDLSDYDVLPSKNKAVQNASASLQTLASVNYSKEPRGVIDVDGTATGSSSFYYISRCIPWANVDMMLSGCPSGGGYSGYCMICASSNDGGSALYVIDTGSGILVPANTGDPSLTLDIYIRVQNGTTVSHKKFSPMLCTKAEWDADPSYEPSYPSMRDGMFPRSEQSVLGAKNLAGVNDINWLNLGSATHTKNGTGLDIQTAAANTSGIYSDNPSAVQSLIDKYGSLTVSFIYKSDIACAGAIGANADGGRFITLPTSWTKYEFTFTPSMTSPHLQFYNKDNTKTPKISVRDIMFRLASDPDDIFAPRVLTNAELSSNLLTALFANPVALTSSDNLNDVKTAGIYNIDSSAPTNAPTATGFTNTYAALFVLKTGTGYTQIYIQGGWRTDSKHIAIRGYGGNPGAWSSWRFITDATS